MFFVVALLILGAFMVTSNIAKTIELQSEIKGLKNDVAERDLAIDVLTKERDARDVLDQHHALFCTYNENFGLAQQAEHAMQDEQERAERAMQDAVSDWEHSQMESYD